MTSKKFTLILVLFAMLASMALAPLQQTNPPKKRNRYLKKRRTAQVTWHDFVDWERTSPRYLEMWENNSKTLERFAVSSVGLVAVQEVLYGMLSAAEGASGTSLWYYNGPLGEFVVYIWNISNSQAGFALVDCGVGSDVATSMGKNIPMGNSFPSYDVPAFIDALKKEGYREIHKSALPFKASATPIKRVIELLPPTMPLWQSMLNNFFVLVFPETMIYFGHQKLDT